MKRICMMLILLILLLSPCMASDSGEIGDFGGSSAADLLPDEAEKQLEDWQSLNAASAGQRAKSLIAKAFSSSEGKLRQALGLCVSMFGVVLLSSVLRTMAQGDSMGALELAGVLGISMLAYGQISGFFIQMTGTVDQMAVFSGGLFPALASATAAMGKLGSSTALYAVTTAVCGLMSRGLELVFLPGISCYMALVTADCALGDDSLKLLADTLKQIMTTALKFLVIGFTAYLSVTGVISGSADSAAIRAAKLTISTAVPVVGSMIADASETLLVSAGMVRGSLGILGLLGLLAVSIGPFLQTGCSYLMLRCTAAAAAATGEKKLSGLISSMAGAVGLITAVTGVCVLLMMIGCVCFMGGTAA